MITTPPWHESRARDFKNVNPLSVSVIKTVQVTAEQAPEWRNIPPIIGDVSLSNPQVRGFNDNSRPASEDCNVFMTI